MIVRNSNAAKAARNGRVVDNRRGLRSGEGSNMSPIDLASTPTQGTQVLSVSQGTMDGVKYFGNNAVDFVSRVAAPLVAGKIASSYGKVD